MQAEPSKTKFDELHAEALSLAGCNENPHVANSCISFVRLLDSIPELIQKLDGWGVLSMAANLQVGPFRDLEILCILFDFTRAVLSWLEGHLDSKDHTSTLDLLFQKRHFVSAFSVLPDEVRSPKLQVRGLGICSFYLRNKPLENPALQSLKSPIEVAELEATLKEAEAALKIGGDNMKQLRLSIMDLKSRLCKAAESLEAVFFSAEPQLPSFLVRAHLREVMQSFLAFQSFPSTVQDSIIESGESLCPIGCRIARPIVEKVVLELLDPVGPFIVGICGPRGIGKTTVAASVASDSKIKRRFVGGVFWIPADQRIADPMSLQSCLWKAVSGSKTVFKSVDEGLTALKGKFLNCLPSLLIVDGAWEASQLEGLMCFDGKHQGRIIVATSNPHILPATDTHIHTLSFVKEEDASDLFLWGAGLSDTSTLEEKEVAAKLVNKCKGLPLFTQALSSTLYPGSIEQRHMQILPSKDGKFDVDRRILVDQKFNTQETGNEDAVLTGSNPSVKSNSGRETNCMYAVFSDCYNSLGLIHPILQECFLDLAAFPEEEWLSLSMLEELWLAFSHGLSHEEIVVILSILVCRSMVDWRLNIPDSCNQDLKIEFKLPGVLHNMASRMINLGIQLDPRKKHCNSHMTSPEHSNKGKEIECRNISSKYFGHMKRIFGFGNAYVKCAQEDIDIKSGEIVKQKLGNDNLSGAIDFESFPIFPNEGNDSRNVGRDCWANRFHQEHRLFVPGCNVKSAQGGLLDESLLSRATKISLCNSNFEELPSSFSCPFLHVGLFSGNAQLSFLPSSVLRNLTQLQVLDLRSCVSLTHLPKAVSALKSLQLLDLSFCTSLRSLPSSIGHLKKLKFLRLFGCTSLTCLPKSTGLLKDLETMQLSGCIKLKTLPSTLGRMHVLKILDLKGCLSLHSLPLSVGFLRELHVLDLSECSKLSYTLPYYAQLLLLMIGIQKIGSMAVPTALWNCSQIEVLRLASLKNLTFLPHSICRLQHIRHLDLSNCRRLDILPEQIGNLCLLQELDLSHTAIRKLPDSVGKLGNLLRLGLQGCSRLLCIPNSISQLPKLRCLDMSECWDLVLLPSSIGNPNSLVELVELNLAYCGFKSLPAFSWHALPKLKHLKLFGCHILSTLPPTMEKLASLEKVDLEGCSALTSLIGIGLGKLEKLEWLSLRNCTCLTSIPTEEIVEQPNINPMGICVAIAKELKHVMWDMVQFNTSQQKLTA
ncbi:hypothetical protein SUGI_0448500 [Cryptomeria japonica]|nr:hypothetical protein SUGI_0448500 [Cryptomeria japonica]